MNELNIGDAILEELRKQTAILERAFDVTYYCRPLWVDAAGEPCEAEAVDARPICPGGVALRRHAPEYEQHPDKRYHPLPEDRHYQGPGATGPTTIRNHNAWVSHAVRDPTDAAPPAIAEPSRVDPEPEMEEVRTDTPQRVPLHGWAHGEDVGVSKQWQATYNRLRPLLATLWRGFDQDWDALWDAWGEHELMAQIRGTDGVFIVTPGSLSIAEMTRLSAEVEDAIGATQDALL
jgi:hypothetical protein